MKYTISLVLGVLAVAGFAFAKEYDPAKQYTVGDTAVYNDNIYQAGDEKAATDSMSTNSQSDDNADDKSGDSSGLNLQPMGGDIKVHADAKSDVEDEMGEKDKDSENDSQENAKDTKDINEHASTTSDNNKGDNEDEGEQHRSAVAAFVAELHKIASSTPPGIGEKVREVARQQNDDNKDVSDKINKVEKRGGFARFFIGTDQDSLDVLTKAASTTQANIDELNKVKLTATLDVQKSLEKEIEALTKEKERIQKVIDKNKGGFSLFGWLVNLF